MKLPARENCLEHDIVVSVNDEWNHVRIFFVLHNEDHLLRMYRILEHSQILLVENDLGDILKRDAACFFELLVLCFVPENVHNLIYGKWYTLSTSLHGHITTKTMTLLLLNIVVAQCPASRENELFIARRGTALFW